LPTVRWKVGFGLLKSGRKCISVYVLRSTKKTSFGKPIYVHGSKKTISFASTSIESFLLVEMKYM